jgi:hypothetical protein
LSAAHTILVPRRISWSSWPSGRGCAFKKLEKKKMNEEKVNESTRAQTEGEKIEFALNAEDLYYLFGSILVLAEGFRKVMTQASASPLWAEKKRQFDDDWNDDEWKADEVLGH